MLSAHWQEGSVPQQEEFVQLFTEMLERMYLTNIASLSLAAVKFEGELISGDHARVSPRLAGRCGDASVEYRLVDHASFASLLERLRSREVSARIEQSP
jgi:ABC-type transporter MlaC component